MRTRRLQSSSDPMSLVTVHRNDAPLKGHIPVLLDECLEGLSIQPDDVVVDATLGGAGHALAMAKQLGARGTFIGIDADAAALERARRALADVAARVILIEGNFRDMESHLGKHEIPYVSKALFDLGWSSYQLDAGRGFSFLKDEPLAMTYASDTEGALTAATIVNTWGEESIADVLWGWGEERYSRQIARGIVEARKQGDIVSSRALGEIIRSAVPAHYRKGHIHPATRTFQALRIAVNDELGAIREGIGGVWKHLQGGGRIGVITFHSIEDREVKRLMMQKEKDGEGKRLTKSPIAPSRGEIQRNPRARSAKLRVMIKN